MIPNKKFYSLKTKSVARYEAEVFYFRFERCGWAVVFVDEKTGTIGIHSDYGDWNFSWPKPGRGDCMLKEFFDEADCDYLARKFMLGRRSEIEEFDQEATKRSFVKELIERRREERIKKQAARLLFNELEGHDEDSEVLFVERLSGDWHDFFDGTPWDFLKRRTRADFLCLKYGILPAIKAGLSGVPA